MTPHLPRAEEYLSQARRQALLETLSHLVSPVVKNKLKPQPVPQGHQAGTSRDIGVSAGNHTGMF